MKYFVSLVFATFLTTTIMAKEIKTEILINATPGKVWKVLANFKEYPNWNPFVRSLTGDVKVGNTIKIVLPGMTFKPKVLAFESNKELRWLGHLLFAGLFDGEHSFILINNGNGTTTFRQSEKFNGILVGLFNKKLNTDTKNGFEMMNQKLKELSER